jgi:hypothetical protein
LLQTEDEALQRALQASLAECSGAAAGTPSGSGRDAAQEHEDYLLAKALAESEQEANITTGRQTRSRQQNCKVS